MSHQQQLDFVAKIKQNFPEKFTNAKVLEVGSLDINGSIRSFFKDCDYIGCDIGHGACVDVVCAGEDLDYPANTFDTIASCECFEHNPNWVDTFKNMHRMAKRNGIIFITCATTGRPEHGTPRTSPADAPFCGEYYKNLTEADFKDNFDLDNMFSSFKFAVGHETHDLYFCGFKK